MLLVRYLYTSIHHKVKGLTKGTPSIHQPLTSLVLGESSYDCWCELSYEFQASCLRPSLMLGELSWGELSLGRDVCNSPRHGLYVNSLLNRKLKSKVDLHWKKESF